MPDSNQELDKTLKCIQRKFAILIRESSPNYNINMLVKKKIDEYIKKMSYYLMRDRKCKLVVECVDSTTNKCPSEIGKTVINIQSQLEPMYLECIKIHIKSENGKIEPTMESFDALSDEIEAT